MVKEGGTISEGQYASEISWRPKPFTGVVDPDRVAEAFADGSTIVLQALHHTWPPLARFCRALEAELGSGAQANSYYTPRRSQGFAVHHDTHDVFVLQVAGEKHWRVYEPAARAAAEGAALVVVAGRAGPDRARADATGRRHALSPSRLAARRAHLGDRLAAHHGRRQRPHLDRRVPGGAGRSARTTSSSAARYRPTASRRSTSSSGWPSGSAPEDVRRRARAKFVGSRRPILDGHLQEVRELDSVTIDSPLERRPTVIADLDGTTLSFEGKHLEFPAHAREELEAVVESEWPFTRGRASGRARRRGPARARQAADSRRISTA